MPCATCGEQLDLRINCSYCSIPTWCSELCCVRLQNVHSGCGIELVGVRRPAAVTFGLLGKSYFSGTLSNLFTALIDVQPMHAAYQAVITASTVDIDRLADTGEAHAKAINRVRTRLNEFDKMLDSLRGKVSKQLVSEIAQLKAALRYDVETGLRFSLQINEMPSLVGSVPAESTFDNSFTKMEELVNAPDKIRALSKTPPSQPLASRFLAILATPGAARLEVNRKFKDQLRQWSTGLDASFNALIKSA